MSNKTNEDMFYFLDFSIHSSMVKAPSPTMRAWRRRKYIFTKDLLMNEYLDLTVGPKA